MKTYRINKNAARLAQGTGFAPELIYNISLVRFQGRNGRCIAAWTPGMQAPPPGMSTRPTPRKNTTRLWSVSAEAERFRRHDEAVARSSDEFRRSLRVGDILYSSWGWEQTNIDFYQVIAIRGQRGRPGGSSTSELPKTAICAERPSRCPMFSRARPIRTVCRKIISASTHTVLRGNGTGSPCGAVGMHNIMLLRISLRATACIKRSATSAARRSIGRLNI